MSFEDCVNRGIAGEEIDKARGEAATALYRQLRDDYRAQGHPPHVADTMAGEDVKDAMRRQFGEERHRRVAHLAFMRRAQAKVAGAKDLGKLGTQTVEFWRAGRNDGPTFISQQQALTRYFNGRLDALLSKHHRDILGRVKEKAGLENVLREMANEATGDKDARAIADAVKGVMEDARRMFNEAGGTIGKLDDYDVPHQHNRLAITQAGFERWAKDIDPDLDWARIRDPLTGKTMERTSAGGRQRFLRTVFDNIAFGREADTATYGAAGGESLVNRAGHPRVLHFKNTDAWLGYNQTYGSRDPFGAIVGHLHSMAGDIVLLREFGANPSMGLDYMRQLAVKEAKARGDVKLAGDVEANFAHAQRMLRVASGGQQPKSARQAMIAQFFSSTRHVASSAMLDRAIISSVSDLNTMRLAAQAVGLNPASVLAKHTELMASSLSRREAAQAGWIMETMANPGTVMNRFQHEVPPAEIAERLSSGVMRAQGLAGWTDAARTAFQMVDAADMANHAGKALADLPDALRGRLEAKGVAPEEWAAFSAESTLFTAGNGAKFASPVWWRQVTDMDPRRADDLFLKMQSVLEDETANAVPTDSTYIRAMLEGEMTPGTLGYETVKSITMVKSFVMAFTANQTAHMLSLPDTASRALYALNLTAGATVLGAVSVQLYELALGRNPKDMADPLFWGEAALRGGGFGVLGDILSTGESSFGEGFGGWAAGPMFNIADDLYDLTLGNVSEVARGKDARIGRDVVKMLDRYTPGADLPYVGVAIDRLLWDNLQRHLDPEAVDAFQKKAARAEQGSGNGGWWMPGSPAPSAPGLGAALGG